MYSIEVWGVDVNPLAIILAVVANMIIGMLWYGPIFGKIWLKLVEKKSEDLKMGATDIIGALIVAFLMATGLNSVIQFAAEVSNLSPLLNIFATAGMISGTFILPVYLNQYIWQRRKLQLIALDWSHQFTTYVVMGAVLSFFVL